MYRITGRIKGVAPLLINTPTEDDFATNSGARAGASTKLTPDEYREKARARLKSNGHGIYMPGTNLYRSMIAGAQKAGLKDGRKAMWPFLEATVFVDHELAFGKDDCDFIDERWGRIPPKTGAMVMIYRPAFREGWELPIGLTVTDDRRKPDDIRIALESAGLLCGIGAHRPVFGRFVVSDWNVEEQA